MQRVYEGKSSKVLNQEMVKLHVTPYKFDVAMGTFQQIRNGEKYFNHTASNEGFGGVFIGELTNGKGAAVFANTDDAPVMFELINSIAQVYNWKGFSKPEQITTVPVNDTLTSKYIGEYITDGIFSEVKKEKDGLYLWTDGISSKIYFTSTTDFRNIELAGKKTFTFDNAGTVTGFLTTYNDELHSSAQRITTLDTLKSNAWPWWVFGRHLVETKNFDKAIAYLSKGLDIAPSGTLLLKDLAHSYLFKGDFTKAIELYRQCLKLGQDDLRKRLKDDFEYFRKAGFDPSAIKRQARYFH